MLQETISDQAAFMAIAIALREKSRLEFWKVFVRYDLSHSLLEDLAMFWIVNRNKSVDQDLFDQHSITAFPWHEGMSCENINYLGDLFKFLDQIFFYVVGLDEASNEFFDYMEKIQFRYKVSKLTSLRCLYNNAKFVINFLNLHAYNWNS